MKKNKNILLKELIRQELQIILKEELASKDEIIKFLEKSVVYPHFDKMWEKLKTVDKWLEDEIDYFQKLKITDKDQDIKKIKENKKQDALNELLDIQKFCDSIMDHLHTVENQVEDLRQKLVNINLEI